MYPYLFLPCQAVRLPQILKQVVFLILAPVVVQNGFLQPVSISLLFDVKVSSMTAALMMG